MQTEIPSPACRLYSSAVIGNASVSFGSIWLVFANSWAEQKAHVSLGPSKNPHWGGLEGRSPPNTIRTRRHARRVRKPCAARFPCAFPRPRLRRRGNVSWQQRPAQPAFVDKLRKGPPPLPASPQKCSQFIDTRNLAAQGVTASALIPSPARGCPQFSGARPHSALPSTRALSRICRPAD